MSHFLRTAAEVIGVAALAVTGVGAIAGAGALAGIGIASTATLATDLGLAAAGAGVLGALTAKKPAQIANPMDWQSNPQAGIPHIMGRMYFGGQIVYRQTFGKDNVNETINTVYSTGPIKGIEGWYFSGVLTAIDASGHPDITDGQKVYLASQLGRQPEPAQLGGTNNPGITTASKLSGLAASTVTLTYDTNGGHTFTTEPQIGAVFLGAPVYDPRKDSTYPGGDGPQRWNDETTWSFTGYDNPGLKAASYLIGYRHNGKKVIGLGLPYASINFAQLVECANVCDANGWKLGGVFYSTDNKWQVYSRILQAGGAVPNRTGTVTGCLVNTPRVSLATFEIDDIIGDWSIQATQSRRDRINSVIPSFMAEQSVTGEATNSDGDTVLQTIVTWGMAPAGAVKVDDYVTLDGGERQKEISYPFVTGVSTDNLAPNQVAQLARYDIENAREFGPISLPMKPRWMGYRPGDVITGGASLTELGLVGQDIMLLQRQFHPASMTVTFTARSETAAKHPFALGQTTTAPPTPSLSGPPLIPVPGAAAWALTAGVVSANGTTGAALFLDGSPDSSVIDLIVVEMRVSTGDQDDTADWEGVTTLAPSFSGKLTITGVQDQTAYQVAVSYRKGSGTGTRLILGPATAGTTSVAWVGGVTGPGKPEDNATVGAPENTNVAGREASKLVSDVDLNANTLLAYQYDQQTLRDYVDGLLYVSGVAVNTAISNETTQRIDGQNALAQSISLIGSKNESGDAFILNLNTTQVGDGVSMLERLARMDTATSTVASNLASTSTNLSKSIDDVNSELTSSINNVAGTVSALQSNLGSAQASITSLQEVVTTPSGGAAAKAVFQLNANDHVVGYATTNDGSTGAIVFDFDSFTLMTPAGVALFQASGDTVTMHNVEVDTLKAGSVDTESLAGGSVTGLTHTTFDDVAVTSAETTILEMQGLTIGDSTDGKAIAIVSFSQDGTSSSDTGMRIRAYLDTGSGYTVVRNRLSGVRVGGANAQWILPVSFPVPITAKGTVSLKVTGQASAIGSGGNTNTSYARDIAVDLFMGAR